MSTQASITVNYGDDEYVFTFDYKTGALDTVLKKIPELDTYEIVAMVRVPDRVQLHFYKALSKKLNEHLRSTRPDYT